MPILRAKDRVIEWGKPSGRIRHIQVSPDDSHAVYVVEERPGMKTIVYNQHNHDVFMPYRYFFWRISKYGMLRGGFGGYMFFSTERVEDFDKPVLKKTVFPNVYEEGGICLGYTETLTDTKPLRLIARALKMLYDKPGNTWMTPSGPISKYRAPEGCLMSENHNAHCIWSTLTPEQVMAANWREARYQSINEALRCLPFDYAQKRLNDETMEILMKDRLRW